MDEMYAKGAIDKAQLVIVQGINFLINTWRVFTLNYMNDE